MGIVNTGQLDKINEQLEGVLNLLDNYCENIQKEIDNKRDQAQSILNEKIDDLGEDATVRLQAIRQKTINSLKPQVEKITQKIQPIITILNALPISADLGAVVQMLTSIVNLIIEPYQPYIQLLSELPPKITELSTNIQAIVSYQPQINPPPGVTVPTPQISCPPITPGDIGL